MKHPIGKALCLIFFACLGLGRLQAEDPNGKAADNRIYAQTLVNELMREQSDLLIVGLHAQAPGTKIQAMIACNLDHIGNPDSDDDLAAGRDHKTILEPKSPAKFEILMPLKDDKGNYLGAIVMIFKYHEVDTELAMYRKGLAIRDGLAKKIPDLAALFVRTK